MADEPQNKPVYEITAPVITTIKLDINIQPIKVEIPDLSALTAPHSQFWTISLDEINAKVAADRQAFNEMLAREVPSCVAPSDSEKALKKMTDETMERVQFVDPSTFLRKPR